MDSIGLEFGSTRIKSVLADENGKIKAVGIYEWENKFENGYWTYSEEDIKKGMSLCLQNLFENCKEKFNVKNIGISGMMHGYIALDKNGKMLVPFRTWRNTGCVKASAELSKAFGVNIPTRWSVSHLYQAILDNEPHINEIDYITTLSGYIHFLLTGKKVLGIGDASGMFPIDYRKGDFDETLLEKFDSLANEKGFNPKLRKILPKVLRAGREAGVLTEAGEKLFNNENLKRGIAFCPPEGDAGTGMVATDSVKVGEGNLSAGTSAFVMVVLEKPLSKSYPEIDIVATPDGLPVAMVHCNNCTADINAFASLFDEVLKLFGVETSKSVLFEKLFAESLKGREDCGKAVNFNYISGEPLIGLTTGKSMVITDAERAITLPNFMKSLIYGALISLRYGMEILWKENVKIHNVCGHGGFFKGGEASLKATSEILKTPVTVMENAGEGGAWGMALLASYKNAESGLPDFLENIFSENKSVTYRAEKKDVLKTDEYIKLYDSYLKAEKALNE